MRPATPRRKTVKCYQLRRRHEYPAHRFDEPRAGLYRRRKRWAVASGAEGVQFSGLSPEEREKVDAPYLTDLGVRVFEPPLAVPDLELHIVWHDRNERDEAHRWLRSQLFDLFSPEEGA